MLLLVTFTAIVSANTRLFHHVYSTFLSESLLVIAAVLTLMPANATRHRADTAFRLILLLWALSAVVFWAFQPAYSLAAAVSKLEQDGLTQVQLYPQYSHISMAGSSNLLVRTGYVFEGELGGACIQVMFNPVTGAWFLI